MSVARLGLEVTSAPVERATVELDQLTVSAGKAEAAAGRLERETANLGRQTTATASSAHQLVGAAEAEARALGMSTAAANINSRAMQVNGAASRMAAMQQRNLVFQLNDVAVSLASGMNPMMVAMQQGSQISQIYGPDEGGLGRAFRETGKLAAQMAARLGPVAIVVGGVTAGFAALRSEIEETTGRSVTFGNVVSSAVDMAVQGLATKIEPAIKSLGAAWEWVETIAREQFNQTAKDIATIASDVQYAVELISVTWQAGVDRAKALWSALPEAIGGYAYQIAANVIGGVESLINGMIQRLNGLSDRLPEWAPDWLKFQMDPVKLEGPKSPFGEAGDLQARLAEIGAAQSAAYGAAGQARGDRMAGIASWDPFSDLAAGAARNLAEAEEAAKKTGKSLKDAANDNLKPWSDLGDRINEAKGITNGFFSALRQGLANGEGFWGSFKGAALNAIEAIASKIQTNLIDNLFSLNAAGGGGGLLGGLTSLLGFGLPAGGLFASGGYTGAGGTHEPAGIVHRGEYVMSASAVNRLGVGYLDALHGAARGYAGGGYVEPSPGVSAGEPGGFGERLAA